MKTYSITIEEHVNKTIQIQANNIEEAMGIAQKKYRNDEIDMGKDVYVSSVQMCADDGEGDCTEWTEL